MLQAKTGEQQEHIADILQNTSTYGFDKNGFYIDDFISYEEMAQIVDYLREESNGKSSLSLKGKKKHTCENCNFYDICLGEGNINFDKKGNCEIWEDKEDRQ